MSAPFVLVLAIQLTCSRRLRATESLTDFTVVCGERSWKVHQAVLGMHSEVMLKACEGELKVSLRRGHSILEDTAADDAPGSARAPP